MLQWLPEEIGPKLGPAKPMDLMVLSPETKDAVDEARFWRDSERWYKERNIPWKRGWLLAGEPGTGKTSLARAVAQELDLPVFVFDLASLSNEELRDAWRRTMRNVPCMALLEDMDCTFEGRKNIAKTENGLSFDALLNTMDGMEGSDGLLMIVTTNHIEKVDAAISSRPGRIDRVLQMTLPDRAGLLQVAKRILGDRSEDIDALVDEGIRNKETVCKFQEKCGRMALQLHWEKHRQRPLATKPKIGNKISVC